MADEALVLQSQLLKIGRPPARSFTVFSNWFQMAKPFLGRSRDLVQDRRDFIALKASSQDDRLSRLVENWTGLIVSVSLVFHLVHVKGDVDKPFVCSAWVGKINSRTVPYIIPRRSSKILSQFSVSSMLPYYSKQPL